MYEKNHKAMQENTNKAIAINTVILYARLIINSLSMLFCTRFALKALGVDDFGLYSILGSVITFINILNTIMLSTSNRFIAVAIGKGDNHDINNQLNVNLSIHVVIAIVTLIFAVGIGEWYISNYVNYCGDISVAYDVFRYSVVGSVISFIGVPYNGLLMAKEKFSIFCVTDIIMHLGKMAVAMLILYFFENKLQIYAFSFAILTAIPTFAYYFYCRCSYPEITRIYIVRNKVLYKKVFSFSTWVGYGAIATVGRTQAAALLLNAFFNTAMNAALGIANQINSLVSLFATNVTQPIAPQITKNYANGNLSRCTKLLVFNTKISYLTVLLISSPFLVSPEWIINLWLGTVPKYVVSFLTLIIIDTLVGSLNSGVSNIIFANGNIKSYQFWVNTLRLFSVFLGYLALKAGCQPFMLFYVYIAISIIIFFVVEHILRHSINFDDKLLIKDSYVPSIIVTVVFSPALFVGGLCHPVTAFTLSTIYLLVIIYKLGLKKNERDLLKQMCNKLLRRN